MLSKDIQVSFFSFQDIVTSLSGIMIIVVLVLALQLVERTTTAIAKANPEYANLVQEVQQARERLALAKSAMIPPEWEEDFMPFFGMSKETLDSVLALEHQAMEDRQQSLAGLRQRMEEQKGMIQEAQAKIGAVSQENSSAAGELSAMEKRHEVLLAKYERLQDESEALREEIGITDKKLAFSFTGIGSLTPLLVECRGDGTFRAVKHPADKNPVSEFRNLKELCKWLKGFDMKTCYPVLLFRPGTIERSGEIQDAIQEVSPDVQFGREPVGDNESIF